MGRENGFGKLLDVNTSYLFGSCSQQLVRGNALQLS